MADLSSVTTIICGISLSQNFLMYIITESHLVKEANFSLPDSD